MEAIWEPIGRFVFQILWNGMVVMKFSSTEEIARGLKQSISQSQQQAPDGSRSRWETMGFFHHSQKIKQPVAYNAWFVSRNISHTDFLVMRASLSFTGRIVGGLRLRWIGVLSSAHAINILSNAFNITVQEPVMRCLSCQLLSSNT